MPGQGNLIGPFPAGRNPDDYDHLRRRVFWKMPSGLFLVGSHSGERRNLMTANWVTQLSSEPKLLGVSVENGALTHELISTGRCFALSLIDREDRAVVRRFVKPANDDRDAMMLNGFDYVDAPVSGAPVLLGAVAFLDCALEREVTFTSHTLFVGEVVDAGFGTLADRGEQRDVLRMEDTRMNYGG